MPVMDGYDTIRAIRKISGFKVLPIVAVTGKAAAGERQRCLDAGADDYIPKPVDTAELLAALTPWLPTREALASHMSIATRSSRPATDPPGRPRHRAAPILIVDDNPAKRLALKAVLAPLGYVVVEAESGADGPALRHGRGVRGHPARRPDADHGRIRDGSPDPAAGGVGADPDHLHHRACVRRDHGRTATRRARSTSSPPPSTRTSSAPRCRCWRTCSSRRRRMPRRRVELQVTADQLRLLTEAAPIGIFQTDAQDRYSYTNAALDRDHRRPQRRSGRGGVARHDRRRTACRDGRRVQREPRGRRESSPLDSRIVARRGPLASPC